MAPTFQAPGARGVRVSPATHLRAILWLAILCMLDFGGPILAGAMLVAIFVDQLLRTGAIPLLSPHRVCLPMEVRVFLLALVMNLAIPGLFIALESRAHVANVYVTYVTCLVWATFTAPSGRPMHQALNVWSRVLICVLSALLFTQVLTREITNEYLDIHMALTGEPARSSDIEFDEGSRPTSLFVEPSNHAIAIFLLMFVNTVTGSRPGWLTIIGAASCLLTGSTMGAILAVYLVLDETITQVRRLARSGALLTFVLGVLIAVAIAISIDASDLLIYAIQRVLEPETPYDPVAARMFVPLAILDFTLPQHFLGTGVANFASFPGVALADSSLFLVAYFQLGWLGLLVLAAPLRAYARAYSLQAALMLGAVYLTKIGLLLPAFWALAALAHSRPFRRDRSEVRTTILSRDKNPAPALWNLRGRRNV